MARVSVGRLNDFQVDSVKLVKADGKPLLIVRTTDGVCAVQSTCVHMPLPLAGGKLEGELLTCPWHNSQFNVCTGENIDWVRGVAGVQLPGWSRKLLALGKKPQALATYPVSVEADEIFVEI